MIFVEEKPAGFPSDESIKEMADYFYGRGCPSTLPDSAVEYLKIAATTAGKKIREAIQLYEFTYQTGIKAKLNYADHGPDAMVVGDYPDYDILDGCLIELKEEHPNEANANSCLNYKHKYEDLSKKRMDLYKEKGMIHVGFGRNGMGVYMVAQNMLKSADFDKMEQASKKKSKKNKMGTAPSNINPFNLIKAVLYQDKPEYFRSAKMQNPSSFYYLLKNEQTKHNINSLASRLEGELKAEFVSLMEDAYWSTGTKKCTKLHCSYENN